MEKYADEWNELTRILKKVYGIHDDPTDLAKLCYIDTRGERQRLCTLTYSIKNSDSHDFETICEAIVKKRLETYGIARAPGLKLI
jgi:hypothetical protein